MTPNAVFGQSQLVIQLLLLINGFSSTGRTLAKRATRSECQTIVTVFLEFRVLLEFGWSCPFIEKLLDVLLLAKKCSGTVQRFGPKRWIVQHANRWRIHWILSSVWMVSTASHRAVDLQAREQHSELLTQ